MSQLQSCEVPATTGNAANQNREQLAAMARELKNNRVILDGLANSYAVFRFTGGFVAREPWCLGAINSYLQRPFAADRISTTATARYGVVAERIMELGREIAASSKPRTLRSRHGLADFFARAASECQTLSDSLESATMGALEGM